MGRGGGGAIGCYAPTTNLDGPTRNLQSIKHKHVDQPAKQRSTPYRIHLLPLFYVRSWRELIFKNVCVLVCKVFCAVLQSVLCNQCWFCGLDKGAFYADAYIT